MFLLEFVISVPMFMVWAASAIAVAVFALLWWVVRPKLHGPGFWLLIIFAEVFVLSAMFSLVFLEQPISRHLFSVFIAIVAGIIVHNIYTFLWEPHRYQPYAIENLSTYVNIMSIFFFVSASATLHLLTSFSMWPLALMAAVVVGAVTLQTLWAQKIPLSLAMRYAFIFAFGVAELYLAASFLPVRPYVLAIFVVVPFYFFLTLTSDWLLERFEASRFQRRSFFAAALIAIASLTSQWL